MEKLYVRLNDVYFIKLSFAEKWGHTCICYTKFVCLFIFPPEDWFEIFLCILLIFNLTIFYFSFTFSPILFTWKYAIIFFSFLFENTLFFSIFLKKSLFFPKLCMWPLKGDERFEDEKNLMVFLLLKANNWE